MAAMNALNGTYIMRVNFYANLTYSVFCFLGIYGVFYVLGVRATISHKIC